MVVEGRGVSIEVVARRFVGEEKSVLKKASRGCGKQRSEPKVNRRKPHTELGIKLEYGMKQKRAQI